MSGGKNGFGSQMLGTVSGAVTGGAYSTNGKGWAQGGNFQDAMMNSYAPVVGAGINAIKKNNHIDVPGETQKAQWQLSGADGKLRSDLLLNGNQPAAFGQSQNVLNQLQSRATAQGPSAQAGYLQQANQRNTMNALDNASNMQRSQLADATSNLAMRGGTDAGSRERLQRSSTFDGMMNKQKTLSDSAANDLSILGNDEAQKTQMMQALPSQLLAQAGFEQAGKQFDIGNTLNTVGGKYNTDMQAWGANQSAREQAMLANKKGGMFGLGIGGIL